MYVFIICFELCSTPFEASRLSRGRNYRDAKLLENEQYVRVVNPREISKFSSHLRDSNAKINKGREREKLVKTNLFEK